MTNFFDGQILNVLVLDWGFVPQYGHYFSFHGSIFYFRVVCFGWQRVASLPSVPLCSQTPIQILFHHLHN
ncbi:Uncharacterised protein [Mycobacteroides abscessus subsp. abscessus]|nr:Uncharacterised protein [Mycobacteroides abscessus subsp. abscessus]